jgi:anti-sigma factor RsiW
MSESSANIEPEVHELLVAYLDGELDAEAARGVEERLASDPALRMEMQRLDRAWHLLDALETEPVDEQFTRTTLEMTIAAAEEELQQEQAERPRRQLKRTLLLCTAVAVAALCGFLGVRLLTPDPNRQLLEDLPVIENLEQYRAVGDIEFLRALHQERLFDDGLDEGAGQ